MADQQHLAILRQGVSTWNHWRQEHPNILPDLCSASLIRMNLSGIDFSRTDLSGAHLMGSRLRHARLCYADLQGANLTSADLSDADLINAKLDGACLQCTKLDNVDYVGLLSEKVIVEGMGL